MTPKILPTTAEKFCGLETKSLIKQNRLEGHFPIIAQIKLKIIKE